MSIETFRSYWYGEELTPSAIMCMNSFLTHGFVYELPASPACYSDRALTACTRVLGRDCRAILRGIAWDAGDESDPDSA